MDYKLDLPMLKNMLGGLGDGFILTDRNEKVVFMNKAAEDLFEYTFSPDATVGFSEICRLENVDTRERFFSPVRRAMRSKQTVGLRKNIGFVRSDGPVYLSATCSPTFDENGQVSGSTAIFRDVTRMRRLEKKVEADQSYMRAVFEAAKIGICTMNIRGELIEINDPALETLGEDYITAIGKQFGDAIHCINSLERGCGRSEHCKFCVVRNNIETALVDDFFGGEFVVAVQNVKRDEPIWLQMFLTQVWNGSQKQIVLTMINISKRKQKEQELTTAKRDAEAASNTKTQFLANMSHEIRTPINGMTGMINLVLKSQLTEEQRENLVAAKQCSEDLLKIINDILDYAKLENGKMQIEKLDLDLPQLMKRVCSLHSQMAENKGLFFKYISEDGLPQFVKGDPVRIRQILHNLLTNALKFTPSGGITLGVGTFSRGSRNYLEFYVEDTGIGMSIEEQAKLFKPFSQVDGSITRRFGGTGLGLMIVKELVSAMAGDISVTSKQNMGSRFTFIIPMELAEKADLEVKDQTVFVNPYLTGEKPMVQLPEMDDNDDIADLLKYCNDKLGN